MILTKDNFKKVVEQIKLTMEKDNKFNNAICSLNKNGEGIAEVYQDEIDMMVYLLCKTMNVPYNHNDEVGDEIQEFLFDYPIDEIPEGYHFETVDELYDAIIHKYNSGINQNDPSK